MSHYHIKSVLLDSWTKFGNLFIISPWFALWRVFGINPVARQPIEPIDEPMALTCETFDTGWTDGANIDNADWYSNNGPTIETGQGVAGTWGVSPSGNILHLESTLIQLG